MQKFIENMAAAQAPAWKKLLARYAPTAIVLGVALTVRLYKWDSPLWLDELFGYRLVQQGVSAIWQNSWKDPHPPLYYLLQGALTGFGQLHTTWAWRWLPVVLGFLWVLVFWRWLRKLTDAPTRLAVGLSVATAPILVFYSQEARPFVLLQLMAAVTTGLTLVLLKHPHAPRQWAAWVAASLLGLYTGYAYLMVLGVQVFWLGLHHYRQRVWWVATGCALVGVVGLWPWAASSLRGVANEHEQTNPLTFWRTLQVLLAGEPLRYDFSVAHTVMPLLALGLALVAVVQAWRTRNPTWGYLLLQGWGPMALFFALSPVMGLRLPLPESKQFLGLLPALWASLACGLMALRGWLARTPGQGYWLTGLVGGLLLAFNGLGLGAYWYYPKSPEGLTVLSLEAQAQPGDSVVSLHYSPTLALGFYTEDLVVYLRPQPVGETYQYQMTDAAGAAKMPDQITTTATTADIRAKGMFWVMAHPRLYREALPVLIEGCAIVDQKKFVARNAAFEWLLVVCP